MVCFDFRTIENQSVPGSNGYFSLSDTLAYHYNCDSRLPLSCVFKFAHSAQREQGSRLLYHWTAGCRTEDSAEVVYVAGRHRLHSDDHGGNCSNGSRCAQRVLSFWCMLTFKSQCTHCTTRMTRCSSFLRLASRVKLSPSSWAPLYRDRVTALTWRCT